MVVYNKRQEVKIEVLQTQHHNFNVFQKAQWFKEDCEYRFAVIDYSYQHALNDYLELRLGDCSDIMSIVDL